MSSRTVALRLGAYNDFIFVPAYLRDSKVTSVRLHPTVQIIPGGIVTWWSLPSLFELSDFLETTTLLFWSYSDM
jgi:hypothetical protein